MKKLILLLGIIFTTYSFSQSTKTVLGTFSYGCKIFNYDFKKTSNGLYSFKILSVDGDDNQVKFSKDTIGMLRQDLDTITSYLNPPRTLAIATSSITDVKKDSITKIIAKYNKYFENILNDKADIAFWKQNKDSIKILLAELEKSDLLTNEELSQQLKNKDQLKKFNARLKDIVKSISEVDVDKEYTINEFKRETFVTLFGLLLKKKEILTSPECSLDGTIDDLAQTIFYSIKPKLEFADDEPITAYLKLKNTKIDCYFYSDSPYVESKGFLRSDDTDGKINNKFNIENIGVEFEDGVVKNLFVDLIPLDINLNPLTNLPLRFNNPTPISVSSRNDKNNFSLKNIFLTDNQALVDYVAVNSDRELLINKQRVQPRDTIVNAIFCKLSDLFDYQDVLENDKEDYSPVNCVVNLNPKNPVVELKKEKRSRLLSLKTFTDAVGLKGDEPNGLIQIEASRKFNLWTARVGTKYLYYGALTYIEPKLIFSKIEKNNRSLILTEDQAIKELAIVREKKVFRIDQIELYKYQNSAFDVDLNLAKYNIPNIKSNFQFNLSGGILRTEVQDSLVVIAKVLQKSTKADTRTLNTLRWGFSVLYELKPDSRYGLVFGYDYRKYKILSENHIFNRKLGVIQSYYGDFFLKTNDKDKLFFRYKYSFASPVARQNFVQIQLGYSLEIFNTATK